MIPRRPASPLLSLFALPIILSLAGCSSLKAISVSPAAGTVVLTAIGQTAQYTALGVSQRSAAARRRRTGAGLRPARCVARQAEGERSRL